MAEQRSQNLPGELRDLPKVDALAASDLLAAFPHSVRVAAARKAIEGARASIRQGKAPGDVTLLASAEAESLSTATLRPAINLTGVILHTGLGRARLAASAVHQIAETARSHATVEFDVETGARGDRQSHVHDLLCGLTGAEDALVVNNCAATVVLTLAALGSGREVLLSRGQMVEIGGSFRLPDIVRQSGCRLIELGCTNKTRLSDYEAAVGDETAAILRCHPSNFRIIGFSEEPAASDLAALARRRGLVFIDDVGSGCLVDTSRFGLPKEPTLQDALNAGADVVTASGDKLLGGPQAGLILGRAEAIAKLKRHPLARAFRIDKLTLAGLEATLRLYRDGQEMEIPTLSAMARDPKEIKKIASKLAKAYSGRSEVSPCLSEVGGGAAPGTGLPSYAAVLYASNPDDAAKSLRMNSPSIVGRIHDGAVWLDPRTLEKDEIPLVERALRRLEC